MSPKEIAAHYEAKVFDTPEAAKVAGFVITETLAPRNVWNKASAAQSLALKLRDKKLTNASDRDRDNQRDCTRQPRDDAQHGAAASIHPRRAARNSQTRWRDGNRSRLRYWLSPSRDGEDRRES